MAFPFSSSGSIEVNSTDPSEAKSIVIAIESALREAKATKIMSDEGGVSFRAGLLRSVSSWNQLVAISSGKIEVRNDGGHLSVRYRIYFVQLFIVVTLMVGLMSGYLGKAPVGVILIGWCWLFGGNYVVTLYRFPRFLREAVQRGSAASIRAPESPH